MAKSGNYWNMDVDVIPAQDNTYDLGSSTKRWRINGKELGEAAEKSVDTSISTGSTSSNVPTSKAVADLFGEGHVSVSVQGKVLIID